MRIGRKQSSYRRLSQQTGQGIWYQDYGCELDSPAHTRNGYVSSAVLLYDAEYVTLQDLELTNSGQDIIGERYSAPGIK